MQDSSIKLLRNIKSHILEEPRRFAMGSVHANGTPGTRLGRRFSPQSYNAGNPFEQEQKLPRCGTAACIMGWVDIFCRGEEAYPYPREIAMDKLCSAKSWPARFSRKYAVAKTPLERAKIAARRIDHFIKTDGAE